MQAIDAARWFDRARDHERRGQAGDAIRAFQNGLALAPASAGAWFEFGRLLRRCGATDAATEALERAIGLGFGSPEVAWLEAALVHAELRRDDAAAEAALRRALAIRPDYAPAWLNLGNLCEDLGRREAAAASYREALAHADAGSPLSDLALARVLEVLLPPTGSPEVREAEARVARPYSTGPERADLAFALGRCLERAGRHGDAFASFLLANRIVASGHHPYNRDAAERRVERQCAALVTDRDDGIEFRSPTPIFIVGLFRSGSTLLEQMLAAHPAITSLGESPFFPHLAARLPDPASRQPTSEAIRFAEAYERHAAQWQGGDAPAATFRIDKRPDNVDLLPLILQVRPDARILVTRRDPRDNGLSIFQHHLDPRIAAYSTELGSIGHHIGLHRRFVQHAAAVLGDRLRVVDYEALTAAPEATISGLLSWLGLPSSDDCLRFHERTSSVRTASVWQVREPVHARSQGRWMPYSAWLGPLLTALEEGGALRP